VADGSDLVHEDHHISLEYFGGIGEVADITKTEQRHDLLTGNHDVDDGWVFDDPADDLCACLAEAYSQ
jgi:hypothetical protein